MKQYVKIESSTTLCPLVIPDTYGTFNFEFFHDSGFDEMWTRYELNYSLLDDALTGVAQDLWSEDDITEALRKIGLRVSHIGNLQSPREYNFITDWLNITFEGDVDLMEIQDYMQILWKDKKVRKFAKENYATRSGFISFMPENFEEMWYGLQEEDFRAWSALVTLTLIHEGIDFERYQETYMTVVLEDYFPVEEEVIVREDLIRFYESESGELDILVNDIYNKVPRHERVWEGLHDSYKYSDVRVDNGKACDLILWANENDYSVEDLRKLAS